MRVYQCDSCKKTITNPHAVKMKEFYAGVDFDNGISFPVDVREKIKIHLCDDCYKGLRLIAKKVKRAKTMAEKEYIEREEVREAFRMEFDEDYADDVVDKLPTADVQEVVRCKDCIFGKYDDDLNMILCKRIYNLSDGEYVYNDLNDFCSYGAKMDKE